MVAWHLHPASWSSGTNGSWGFLASLLDQLSTCSFLPLSHPPALDVSRSSLSPFSSCSLDFPTLGHGGCFWLQGCSPTDSWMGWRFRKQILESLLALPSQGSTLEVGPDCYTATSARADHNWFSHLPSGFSWQCCSAERRCGGCGTTRAFVLLGRCQLLGNRAMVKESEETGEQMGASTGMRELCFCRKGCQGPRLSLTSKRASVSSSTWDFSFWSLSANGTYTGLSLIWLLFFWPWHCFKWDFPGLWWFSNKISRCEAGEKV